jgi:hypothetical protein
MVLLMDSMVGWDHQPKWHVEMIGETGIRCGFLGESAFVGVGSKVDVKRDKWRDKSESGTVKNGTVTKVRSDGTFDVDMKARWGMGSYGTGVRYGGRRAGVMGGNAGGTKRKEQEERKMGKGADNDDIETNVRRDELEPKPANKWKKMGGAKEVTEGSNEQRYGEVHVPEASFVLANVTEKAADDGDNEGDACIGRSQGRTVAGGPLFLRTINIQIVSGRGGERESTSALVENGAEHVPPGYWQSFRQRLASAVCVTAQRTTSVLRDRVAPGRIDYSSKQTVMVDVKVGATIMGPKGTPVTGVCITLRTHLEVAQGEAFTLGVSTGQDEAWRLVCHQRASKDRPAQATESRMNGTVLELRPGVDCSEDPEESKESEAGGRFSFPAGSVMVDFGCSRPVPDDCAVERWSWTKGKGQSCDRLQITDLTETATTSCWSCRPVQGKGEEDGDGGSHAGWQIRKPEQMRAAIATKENDEDDESKEGNTGPAFVNIRVTSGFNNDEQSDMDSKIWVNGCMVTKNDKCQHVVVIDEFSGEVLSVNNFTTFFRDGNVNEILDFLRGVKVRREKRDERNVSLKHCLIAE